MFICYLIIYFSFLNSFIIHIIDGIGKAPAQGDCPEPLPKEQTTHPDSMCLCFLSDLLFFCIANTDYYIVNDYFWTTQEKM